MMRRFAAFLIIGTAAAQSFTCPSGNTTGVGGDVCCRCEPGFAQPDCTTCKAGYALGKDSSGKAICRNGITDCEDALPYPHGCSGHGKCNSITPPYFGCACDAGFSGQGCQNQLPSGGGSTGGGGCHPDGVQMYTQQPLEVTSGEPFSILLWGCNLNASDSYRVIPLNSSCSDTVPAGCLATASGLASGSETVGSGCTSIEVTGNTVLNSGAQGALDKLKLSNTAAQGSMYKLCRKPAGQDSFGPVQTHDERGYRDPGFVSVTPDQASGARPAALLEEESGEEWECCDKGEIRVGDICLPLWLWIIAMLIITAIIAYLLWKMQQLGKEIEMERNNRQFNQFEADDSALKMDAAKRAGADDDV
eukprot:Hpha_TRINITY_DN16237_c1_g5::TRINITY_DN16237_c1_g5_i1::g.16491::m.16491